MVIVLIFSFFPTMVNPGAEGMNYSSLMTGTVGVFAVAYYLLHAKKIYKGPVVEVDFQ